MTFKEQIEIAALALFAKAADKHMEGVDIARNAAKLELMAELLDEEELKKVFDKLVAQGVVVVDKIPEFTSTGGDA